MSKKRKSRHRIPNCALELKQDAISDRYWAEVWASTARLERQHRKAIQAAEAAERRADKARRELEQAVGRAKNRKAQQRLDQLLIVVEERRQELRVIESLMVPAAYNGRDSKRRTARHESGSITIPLGATTGIHPKREPVPVFPVRVTHQEITMEGEM